MSIYGGRRGLKIFNDVFEETPIADDSDDLPPAVDAGFQRWQAVRRAAPAGYLLASTRKWVESLPADVYPKVLARRYPRIVNLIAAQWTDRDGCPKLFEDLLGDRRGGRAGFPPGAYRDIVCLQEYWYNGHGLR
ncbi:MAG TPA: hypothetical protein VLU54_11405 [Casimicrobiaceae bacterium]|nr:hypothetical protein [Casimicrobiaceae bacterium]